MPRRERMTSDLLRVPCLLAAAGGFIDCFAWVAYGQVFANAQTGNIVLFLVYAAGNQWPRALNHVPPMLAFFPGVLAAQWIRRHYAARGEPRADAICLGAEIATLAAIGLLPPGVPDAPVVFAIAFVAALQNSGFSRVGKWSYTSVVTTGNLRTLGQAFFHGVFPGHDPGTAAQARAFGAVCSCFLLGALAGAIATVGYGRPAIVAPIALLLLALLACLRQRAPPTSV